MKGGRFALGVEVPGGRTISIAGLKAIVDRVERHDIETYCSELDHSISAEDISILKQYEAGRTMVNPVREYSVAEPHYLGQAVHERTDPDDETAIDPKTACHPPDLSIQWGT
jgi:hypothetical protein